jgi:ATP-dependent DNA helicase RecG
MQWDDYFLNPKELIEAIWTQIPDWKEGIEVSDGMFRRFIANYEEDIIRELMANALVHRPYTQRGNVFINLYPDRLEVINPGLFPIGITPQNILHKDDRRNEKLAQVFFDLHLMDKEGSGIDKIYEILLSNGKQVAVAYQGDDFVQFTLYRHVAKPDIITFIKRADEQFQLTQKERICLGLIAQYNSLSALEFSDVLGLPNQPNAIRNWIGRLPDLKLIESQGKTKATVYFISPAFLKKLNFKGKTNLKTIEPHRLEELIYKDIKIYQPTAISKIQERIGTEISKNTIQKTLKKMCDEGVLKTTGMLKTTKYFIRQNL